MKQAISRKNLWEKTPQALKICVGWASRLAPPAFILGKRFRQTLRFVEEAQSWPVQRAREYQLAQLRRVCTLAYEKTTFYKREFDAAGFHPQDLGQPEDINALPTIDKDTLREHLAEMCTVPLTSSNIDYVSTGGSSGMPLRFYIGADRSAIEYAYLVSSWQRAGYRMHMAQAVFRGQIVPEDRTGLRREYDPILRRHYYSNFHMDDDTIRRYLEHIGTIGPCYLHVYPSSVNALTRSIERNGLCVPRNVHGILAGSEIVYAGDREDAERVLGCRYLSWYGHCEKLVLAAECESSTDYHVWPTYGYCELVDEQGWPVTERGKTGEIVGTGFINTVTPFIRYRTGDYATYVGDRCQQCGREHTIITKIEGRWPQGGLVARDGSEITMTVINVHDDTLENILEYQFFQDSPGKAIFRVVPSQALDELARSRILNRMNERLQGQVDLALEVRSELQRTKHGKLLRVIQKIPETVAVESQVAASCAKL